ncbi:MAG: S41 family peptidase [Rhizomicrobium sp.]
MRTAVMCGCFFALMTAGAPAAQKTDAAAKAWHILARTDIEAAYALLEDNHPAAVPTVGDTLFVSTLRTAHARALARVPTVANYEGYIATMSEFANAMGDGHIWSNSTFLPRDVRWAGIIAAKRGNDWVVGNDDPVIVGRELTGARIASCDGEPITERARAVMPFHVSTGDPGFEVVRAGWILIDDGNPFVKKPASCTFERHGRTLMLTLNWKKIGLSKLLDSEWKHAYGQAGFGVREVGAGYWIAIQSLDHKAQAVIDAAAAQTTRLRKAAYVVVDLRGNGGGDDAYGRALAEVLYGRDYVAAILGPKEDQGGCVEAFRASNGNIEALTQSAQELGAEGDRSAAKEYTEAVAAMKAAKAAGRVFTAPLTCTEKTVPAGSAAAAPSLMRAPVFVLTDSTCFSSCIGTVDFFRRLGAIQLGAPTGADTHYSEVREIVLPSGLSTFSTLQAIETDSPRNIGPFEPKFAYTGDIADTAALEKWISDTALPETGK